MQHIVENRAKRRRWSQDDMNEAHASVTNGMAVATTAKMFDVPRMPLSDKVNGRTKLESSVGRPPVLPAADEDALSSYFIYMARQQYPITRSQVI